MTVDFIRYLSARPKQLFLGREPELATLKACVARGLHRRAGVAAIGGQRGIGKSEFLRQGLAQVLDQGAEALAVYCDLSHSLDLGETPPERRESHVWTFLIRSLARQIVAFDQQLPLLNPPLLGASAARLARLGFDSQLGPWAEVITEGVTAEEPASGEEAWRGMLQATSEAGMPTPLVAIDGLNRALAPGLARRMSGALARGAISASAVLLLETGFEAGAWRGDLAADTIDLAPLASAESRMLAEAWAEEREEAFSPEPDLAVVQWLGGNPELIHAWVAAWMRRTDGASQVRRCRESYLDLLDLGPISRRWRADLDRIVPPAARPRIMNLLSTLRPPHSLDSGRFMSALEMASRAGLDSEQAEPIFVRLAAGGYLSRSGESYALSGPAAFSHWISLELAHERAGLDREAARVEVLKDLLGETAGTRGAAAGSSPAIRPILNQFGLQTVPQALFFYDQYFEALGQVPVDQRATELKHATSTICLPEVIGVIAAPGGRPGDSARAAGRGSRADSAHPIMYYAHAYRQGIYQRSHEETWIVGDATGASVVTTAEVNLFLRSARALEQRLGPGRYVKWLVGPDSVSPEALDLIAGERIYCSCLEQLRIIEANLRDASSQAATESDHADQASPPRAASSAPTPIISIDQVATQSTGTTISRLAIAARNENEVIAAMMAEKIALQVGFEPDAAGKVKMAVLEGCLNAIEHSVNPEKEISVAFMERPGELEILIENEGPSFDPLTVPEPDPQEKLTSPNKRGWGIKLMREFMDEVIFEPTGRGTRLRLIMRPGAEREAAKQPQGGAPHAP